MAEEAPSSVRALRKRPDPAETGGGLETPKARALAGATLVLEQGIPGGRGVGLYRDSC